MNAIEGKNVISVHVIVDLVLHERAREIFRFLLRVKKENSSYTALQFCAEVAILKAEGENRSTKTATECCIFKLLPGEGGERERGELIYP